MAGAYCVEAFLRLSVRMGTDNLAYKNYMVAGWNLRFERAFEVSVCFIKKY